MPDEEVNDVQERNKTTVYKLLEEVFEASILEADLTEPVDNLSKLYDSFSAQGFESSFEEILMVTVNESRKSSDIQKIFRFISDFAVFIDNKYKAEHAKNDEDDSECVHPFLEHLFNLLQSWSKVSSYVIRFRSCQLLYMILTSILEAGSGEIDVNTYEKIATLIQVRRKDISANVRAHAVLLAKFFQDPSDHNDPVIAALCWQLQTDPNSRVRQNILEIIAACEETIIPVTKRFLHDVNSLVRNSALLHICHRISPRSYTTEHRILILNQCFYDSSSIVRRNAEQKLIPVWFRAYGDKLSVFFKNLRLGNDCLDMLPFIKPLIHVLFKLVKISQVFEEIDLDLETGLPKSLNGEKIFIWHNFYIMAYQHEKLKKFVPKPDVLAEYLSKHFKESSFDDVYAQNELISFTMDVMDIVGEETCEGLPPLAIDVLKNPFTPRDVIPYAVAFYCDYATKETKEIHHDLLQIVDELMKFASILTGEEQKKLLIKCLDIFCETLVQDNISADVDLMNVKDELVLPYLDSDDIDIKMTAFKALSLYCLLDLLEARQFWVLFEKTIFESTDLLQLTVIKGAFDIFKCHGCNLFGDVTDENTKQFDETLEKLLSHAVDVEIDVKIILKGMFKLYLAHHTSSPVLLAKLIMFMFDPDEGHIIKNMIANFLELFGESSKEAECLTRSFLVIINLLYNSEKSSPYHKVNIKTAALQLLEFAKLYEENKNFDVQEKFKDLLVLKITKKFIKKPWRLSAQDLQEICESMIPKDVDKLYKLKGNVKIIIEDDLKLLEVEKHQLNIIRKLEDLREKVVKMKGEFGVQNQTEFSKQLTSIENFQDIVIKANPASPPLSLWVFYQILSQSTPVRLVSYVHSSLVKIPDFVKNLQSLSSSENCKISLTLIWRDGSKDHEMIVDPVNQGMIEGEVNISRYIARLLNFNYDTDPISSTQIDNWLETAHSSIIHGNNKERQNALKSLNSHLGKNSFLVGNSVTLADIILWSSLVQVKLHESLPTNVSKWYKALLENEMFAYCKSLPLL